MWYNFIITWIFRKLFAAYDYPFERADAQIAVMPIPERKEYFLQAKNLLANPVFKLEMQELVRKYYQELAIKSNGPVEQMAYRLTLKALQDLNKRVASLSSLYSELQIKHTQKL